MECFATVDQDFDRPVWVAREAFFERFDQADFNCRAVLDVRMAYLAEWFELDAHGRRRFRLSPVGAVAGKTQFISGRHRLAVLLAHLEEVPLALAFHPHLPASERDFLQRLPTRSLDLAVRIKLPDLPVHPKLP